ncbi:MAG: pantoate--beta-alanine ligase [Candidatus Omnitrophica bacterium]|nr:pantoate--beta-alanine ligase [Candidatus Omnitrophota bacterium]
MITITTIKDMRDYSAEVRRNGKTIGFVPTMGYLHEGHLGLVRESVLTSFRTVASIFVNPAQFGPNEDLDKYPRNTEKDKELLEGVKADVLFFPSVREMYPEGYSTYVTVEGALTDTLCGALRPGHFRGVATVVLKLLNIVDPDRAFFGQKDAQQAIVIKRMAKDLDLRADIRVMPIIRDEDGLAMSSRNVYLSPIERAKATVIYKSLSAAVDLVKKGERSVREIKLAMSAMLEAEGVRTDYIAAVGADDLRPVEKIKGRTLIAVAAWVGSTRLIDNVIVER